VLEIVGGRNGNATDEQEIGSIQKVSEAELNCEPFAWIAAGEPVLIDHGPLTGVSGIVVNIKGEDRLVLSVTLLRRSVLVEIDRNSAVPLRTSPLLSRPDVSPRRARTGL
jgi:transcription antitermination factor NusG